ncbi:hypothetical protein F5B22DRAFT_237310 [Xylaria bambusicola]|uniref:uncharacterized protein n=1 Tax=Xylaria bambusicola TaxID=326684 RepID=UPI0020075500|nr:uncharacterized protein F5B22DRAFT_237310 [Xylaria bambusicola]KAI0514355.1 hypothetical protein F5B22DRAFT_237310 [Xylaria bambusicola]
MASTTPHDRVDENLNDAITFHIHRTPTLNSQERSTLLLEETLGRADESQESDLSSAECSRPSSTTANSQESNTLHLEDSPSCADESHEPVLSNTEHKRPSAAPTQPIDQLLPVAESLSRMGLFCIVGGSLWILGAFGFLTFLWFGHGSKEAADATKLWRFIALHHYFPQAITLYTLALRVAVSFQAVVCTSMIAAIVLEKHGIQRTQVAWLSVMRGINNGPLKLCGLLVSSNGIATLLRRVELWLLFLIVIVTSALQFSSTLLLSDLKDFTIVGDLNLTQFNDILLYDKDDFHVEALGLQFISQSPVYAVFGEAQANFNATPSPNGLSDTGLIQRSLLPIPASSARSSVRKVEATSVVMTSQSACIRPQINATYNNTLFYDIDVSDVFGYISGTVDYKRSFDNAEVKRSSLCDTDTGCEDVAFECPIPSGTTGDWQTVTCLIDGLVGGGGPANFDPIWDSAGGVWSPNASVVLVITTNMDYKDWRAATNSTLPTGSPYHEWQSYEIGTSQFVNISLCASGFSLGRFHTLMTAPGPLREPQTDLVLTSRTYSTTDVQRFMGVSEPQQSHFDRQILDLDILGAPTSDLRESSPASQLVNYSTVGDVMTVGRLTTAVLEVIMYYQLTPGFQPNVSMSLCYFCTTNGYSVNPEISLLFSDVVSRTGRAANALLSLTTIIFASVYYTYLSTLQVRQDGRIVAVTTVSAPGPCSKGINSCSGYASVTTLLAIHLLCVAVITVVYVRQIRYSRHGNIWHTISQLTGDGLTDVFKEAQHASDADVERIVDKDYKVKVGRRRAGGPVEAVNV